MQKMSVGWGSDDKWASWELPTWECALEGEMRDESKWEICPGKCRGKIFTYPVPEQGWAQSHSIPSCLEECRLETISSLYLCLPSTFCLNHFEDLLLSVSFPLGWRSSLNLIPTMQKALSFIRSKVITQQNEKVPPGATFRYLGFCEHPTFYG